jgi:hypothetical protein
LGRSILTLNPPGEATPNAPVSIFDVLLENKMDELFLVEDSFGGFLEAYQNSKDNKIKLNFGLRLSFLCDVEEKNEEALKSRCKYIIFAKNTKGYKRLIKIWSFAAKDGFYYTPNMDFKTLKTFWNEDDLMLCVPFYDSFLHRNSLEGATCIPEFDFCTPTFFLEDNDIPFDDLIRNRVLNYTKSSDYHTQEIKNIYYKNKEDFLAYLTFRCINNRSTLEKPNIDHMCSDDFCFEAWVDKQGGKVAPAKIKVELETKKTDPNNEVTLTKEEVKEAKKYGNARRDTNVNGELHDLGHAGKPMGGCWRKNDIIACGAEIAFSRYIGKKFVGGVNTFNKPDVDGGWQVRCTDHQGGSLIIRPNKDFKGNKLKDKYALVIYKGKSTYKIAGYRIGEECVKNEYERAPNNGKMAYFVPQQDLRTVETGGSNA